MYLGQLCLSKRCSLFVIQKSYVRSNKRYCFARNYAAIPVLLLLLLLLLLSLLLLLYTAIGLSPCGCGYSTCIQNMKLVTTKLKSGGLHEKHVVATWNFGNHLSICL